MLEEHIYGGNNNKIIWGVLILGVLGVGAWFLMRGDKEVEHKPLAEKIVGVHYAGGGTHTVEGTVTLPNPCYILSVASEKRSGAPEEILLRFTANQTADVCAQALYKAPFRTTFNAADDAVISAEINGVSLPLELTRKERVSAQEGGNFSLKEGEDRWIEDLHMIFTGVEDDSRCPVDVVCVQAGWVTLVFRAGSEEIRLRLPGDQIVPNAAVVGSYIITLVEVKPMPKSDELREDRAYSATLRVEVHDSKG